MDGFQLSQGYRTTARRQFEVFKVLVFFTTQSPGVPGTHLINFDHMKVEITLVLKPPSGLEFGTMYWESSNLTTKIIGKNYLKCKCTVFTNIKQTLHYVR